LNKGHQITVAACVAAVGGGNNELVRY
jgi:hypothetical protein